MPLLPSPSSATTTHVVMIMMVAAGVDRSVDIAARTALI
jgi:hypothetical protein